MTQSKAQNPLWAWFTLIGGVCFLFTGAPYLFMTALIPIWKPDELSFFSIMYITLALCMLIVLFWGMKQAFLTLKAYKKRGENQAAVPEIKPSTGNQKPVWPWVVIVPGALLLIFSGPGAIMLPIMPLFLAGMSTDSGTVPDYVPLAIFFGGYGLIAGYVMLLVKAIKTLKAK